MNNITVFDNELFGFIRMVEIDNEPWFVGKDIALALGYHNPNEAIAEHIDDYDKFLRSSRGSELLKVFNSVKDIQNQFGRQDNWFINESGVYSLIFSSKLEKAKEFKHWVTSEVLPSIRKSGRYEMPRLEKELNKTVAGAVDDVANTAKAIAKVFKVEKGVAMLSSLTLVQKAYGMDLHELKQYLPAAEKPVGTYKTRQVAEKLDKKVRQLNKRLEYMGLQRKINNGWHLTDAGADYGEEIPFKNGNYTGYEIRWRESIFDLLRRGE